MSGFQVVYLTGAPASGKSTLGRRLAERHSNLEVYHYSALLADHLNSKASGSLTEDNLREKSARIITPEDVAAVDNYLIARVAEVRKHSHILIDSHAVTKESYGFRVTGFSFEKLRALTPSVVCMLYAESNAIQQRISENSQGRPTVSAFQADLHIYLQSQVALIYSLHLGLPLYVFDSTNSIDAAAEKISDLLER